MTASASGAGVGADGALRADWSRRVAVDTERLPWVASPSPTVWRKRLYHEGDAESGPVTSVVRFDGDAHFHDHGHPAGEEILVLEGVFSDQGGDWPAGSYLFNPEGFRHAPFSRAGCVIFVRLRQFPGAGRQHVALNAADLPWAPAGRAGVARKLLYQQPGFAGSAQLQRWDAGFASEPITYPDGVELFVLQGSFDDARGHYGCGAWLRLPAGASHQPRSAEGCALYACVVARPK